jgi:hypothetical protein
MVAQVQADLELLLEALQILVEVGVAHILLAEAPLAADQVLLYYVGLQHNNEF